MKFPSPFRLAGLQRRPLLLAALLSLFAGHPAYAENPVPGLRVKVARLCKSVGGDRNPSGELENQSIVSRGPVWLWTVLSGDETALRVLRRKGLLPIRHVWLFAGDLSWSETLPEDQLDDGEPIRVGTISYFGRLASEIADANGGAFDWRTWSVKRSLRHGFYRVRVVFSNGQVVTDANGQPCEVHFRYGPNS
jgi:hypothetical protein